MATAELNEQSTHDDIQKAVDDIVEAQKSDEAEEKGDAQKIAEERDKPTGDMTAETDSGSDDTAPKSEGEKAETGDQDSSEWLTDDLKAEVAAYGIDEKELADFTSRDEVDRALRFFDRSALEAGRKALAETAEETGRDEKGKFTKKEPEAEPEKKAGYEIGLDKDMYDEGLVEELTHMRDHYEQRVNALEARFTEADTRAEEERFDNLVESLGHADLFGKTGSEKSEELQRREDLFVAVRAQQIGLQQLGRPVQLDKSLVNRVARMVFAQELEKKDLKKRTRRLSKQSDGRMGGGSAKPAGPGETLRDEARRLYKELEGAG